MINLRILAVLLFSSLLALTSWAVPYSSGVGDALYEEGKQYTLIDPPIQLAKDGKISVVEFFSYGCSHCFSFESYVAPWQKALPADVEFKRVPVVFNPSWEALARAYYVSEAMGDTDVMHVATFDAIHIKKQNLSSQASIAALYKEQNQDVDKFNKLFNSFGIGTQIKKGDALLRQAKVRGVPALMIQGKYLVAAGQAGSFEDMLKVADYLIEQQRQQQAMPVK